MPFCEKTFDFLFENRLQDSKAWFDAHKEEYQRYVLEPLQELVEKLTPDMLKIDPEFVTEPRVDRTICRIRRDTRFTKDPSLYRDHMWIIFKRRRMYQQEYPGVYFEVGGSGFNYGCGFYQASTSYMKRLRDMILADFPSFLKASHAFSSQNCFHLEGESYKRPRFPQEPEEKRIWLEKKTLCLVAESDDRESLFGKDFSERLRQDLSLLKPMYEFLLEVSLEEQREQAAQASVQQHGKPMW